MKLLIVGLISILGIAGNASAFCGFFVAKADTKLFNQASKVVLVRDGQRTVITMANDFKGDAKDFAIVVPVPVVLQKDQVHVGDPKILDRLDAFSAPRLVEYFDPDPCLRRVYENVPMPSAAADKSAAGGIRAKSLGVTIEAQFTVGEYDILILSAKESSGLEIWLRENGYKIPQGAAELLQPYIRSNTKFFVAKVNLKEYDKRGLTYLRPLQMAFEHEKFMLPIRLGMINANGPQDLIVFALSPKGRIEVANYRTVNIPSNMDIPVYVKEEFSDFYRAMFQRAYEKESRNAVFVEYAWDMAWCDPCAADPLTSEELRKAGVFWLDSSGERSQAQNVYITRIHVRYTREHFPEDLTFQSTPNRENYQGRYVLRHPYKGDSKCEEGERYFKSLPQRFEKEAQTLASLTGWDINVIRKKMGMSGKPKTEEEKSWWNKIFDEDDEE
jgi:hypothetical protein